MRNLGRSLAALRRDLALSQPTTESPDEDAALKAFAIVQRLDSEQTLSPPSLLTTFRLFCVEALSAGQIARRLYCSKTTVLRRLAMLRDKTGADPAQFRRLSPHLAQLEEQFSDSRARHIHRKRLLYDEPDSGDAME
jgi:DNA-directed RNA polymerase specialized sigma24 family protein